MRTILKRRSVLYFWAMFDLFYICRFVWLNISVGRLPLVDDILSFSEIYPQQGVYSIVFFSFSLLFNLSIIFSFMMFLNGWKYARWLVYAQAPFRLFFMIPSISILLWVFKFMSIGFGVISFLIVLISEIIKIGTFILMDNEH